MRYLSIGALIVVFAVLIALGGTAFAGVVTVPEIDPGMASGGLALLAVGTILLIERYRSR